MSDLRYNERFRTDFDVLVGWTGAKLLKVKARNLSAKGMFIEMTDWDLPSDNHLDLYFWCNGHVHTVNASIVHRGLDGIGLLFQQLPLEVHANLWGTLLKPTTPVY